MPWSPVPKFPEIVKKLKASGYTEKVSYAKLRVEIMRVLGLINNKTIARTISAMEDLGYIKLTDNGTIWELCQDKPYDFPKKPDQEADELLDKLDG